MYVKNQDIIATLRARHPVYADVFDVFVHECVLYECNTFVHYARVLCGFEGVSSCLVAAVIDMEMLK